MDTPDLTRYLARGPRCLGYLPCRQFCPRGSCPDRIARLHAAREAMVVWANLRSLQCKGISPPHERRRKQTPRLKKLPFSLLEQLKRMYLYRHSQYTRSPVAFEQVNESTMR